MALLRQRKALDMTHAELANRVGYASVTIHKIETDQLRPSHEIRTDFVRWRAPVMRRVPPQWIGPLAGGGRARPYAAAVTPGLSQSVGARRRTRLPRRTPISLCGRPESFHKDHRARRCGECARDTTRWPVEAAGRA